MDAAYRLGITIVLASLIVGGGAATWLAGPPRSPARAGEDLGTATFDLGSFRLTERSGRLITEADLADRVWIASFIFTRCPLSCPRITSVMKGLQEKLARSDVQLVSISVDPEHDTPEVLAEFARKFAADRDRWWFLTGPKATIDDLVVQRFKLGLQTSTPEDRQAGAEAISHSDRLALVGRGNRVVGYFDSNDSTAVKSLIAAAKTRDDRSWARQLPAVNATLNGICTVLLIAGWLMIRAGRVKPHALCMLLCVVVSTIFLGCYLTYHYHLATHLNIRGVPFRGVGPVRLVYFTILISHTLLATLGVVPLVAVTLTRALRRQFDRHARIARVTFPIWLYVSLTGVVIYLMLFQMPVASGVGLD